MLDIYNKIIKLIINGIQEGGRGAVRTSFVKKSNFLLFFELTLGHHNLNHELCLFECFTRYAYSIVPTHIFGLTMNLFNLWILKFVRIGANLKTIFLNNFYLGISYFKSVNIRINTNFFSNEKTYFNVHF